MKGQSSYSKLIGVMIQILVWVVFALVLFFYQPYLSNIDVPYQFWLKQVIILSMLVVAYYINSIVLVPRFLLKNLTGYYFMIIALLFVVIIFVTAQVDKSLHVHQLMDTAFHKRWEMMNEGKHGPPKPGKGGRGGLDTIGIAIIALVLGISTSVTTIQKWQKDKQEREELEKDKVTSELSFLKAQINPHFFFNTLNNIYALTVVDADVAGKAIHQLSRMMRYLLYDTQSGHTMLSQEIAFVKDYISLMQLRLTDVVKVNIDTPSDLKDEPIAPMIFLPFVENAFKHGVSATQDSHVDIIIWQRDKVLDLTVKNSIMNDNSISLDTNSGIGLVNTKRRLDLLYPGKYKLDISEANASNEYTVHLTIDLS
ncbi:sensor histidine kinase [Mucilaginibacter ginsenosidivorans]|uniref:Sensor histidine kinase n=1 Tax=Mucilaginibacter ginsenosidivorans TaxID=398053 RepID=A0A5B8UWC6_9SPHI|nr:histidine kinase [Mucilaginibacter ginsenosidivorans]QEC63263.1 sensor histidine kinase [Mucilaginibacter ginsenosidivorans]